MADSIFSQVSQWRAPSSVGRAVGPPRDFCRGQSVRRLWVAMVTEVPCVVSPCCQEKGGRGAARGKGGCSDFGHPGARTRHRGARTSARSHLEVSPGISLQSCTLFLASSAQSTDLFPCESAPPLRRPCGCSFAQVAGRRGPQGWPRRALGGPRRIDAARRVTRGGGVESAGALPTPRHPVAPGAPA